MLIHAKILVRIIKYCMPNMIIIFFVHYTNIKAYPEVELGARGMKLTAPCPKGLVDLLELADRALFPPVTKM